MLKRLTTVKCVIFDLDGVLVDMPEGHYVALNRALSIFGIPINFEDHLKVYNGLPTSEKLKMLTEQGKLPIGLHDIIKYLKKLYTKEEVKKRCKPDYSKIIMLKTLKKNGYKLACCSNAILESVEDMLKNAEIYEYFDFVMGNDNLEKPKPDPEIYLKAFEKLKFAPKECIIVEDSEHGYRAAVNSEAFVIRVVDSKEVNLNLFYN